MRRAPVAFGWRPRRPARPKEGGHRWRGERSPEERAPVNRKILRAAASRLRAAPPRACRAPIMNDASRRRSKTVKTPGTSATASHASALRLRLPANSRRSRSSSSSSSASSMGMGTPRAYPSALETTSGSRATARLRWSPDLVSGRKRPRAQGSSSWCRATSVLGAGVAHARRRGHGSPGPRSRVRRVAGRA